ncbi:jg21271, partial [Pararge aegeria aegeria]
MEKALENLKYDIIGISEVRRLGNIIDEYEKFILCFTGQTPGLYGVGFIINKHLKQYIESYIGISERVALLNLKLPCKRLSIIQVYAPTETSDEEEIKTFYKTIDTAIAIAHEEFILMGDFNAKIGEPQSDEYTIMGNYGYGVRNDRGQKLIDFAMENKLAIINTFYKKKAKRRWTWRSPNGQVKNEIDYVLSNYPQMFQNAETLSINYPSDHRPLRAQISLSKPIKSRRKYVSKLSSILKDEQKIKLYKERLQTSLSLLDAGSNESVQTYYDKIITSITKSMQDIHSSNHTKRDRSILTEHTRILLCRRQELQKAKNKTLP